MYISNNKLREEIKNILDNIKYLSVNRKKLYFIQEYYIFDRLYYNIIEY